MNGTINDYIMIAHKYNETCGLRAGYAYTILNTFSVVDAKETKI